MKKTLLYIYVSLWIVLGLLAGCTERTDSSLFAPSAGELVIDATLLVGKTFPVVYLSETVAANETSPFAGRSIDGAIVRIVGPGTVMGYDNTGLGEYVPLADSLVQERTTYRIEVLTPDGRTLTATTTTPANFRIKRWVLLDDTGQNVVRDIEAFCDCPGDFGIYDRNELTYSQGLLEGWFDPTRQPGYQVGLFSLDPDSPLIIDPDFIDEEDLADLERQNASPALEVPDGEIRLPWFAIFFEGRYKIKVYTLDRNWYDYVRSIPQGGFGFGGNAGDNFPEPIFHVEGGIGLFGSAAVDSVGVKFLPRP